MAATANKPKLNCMFW